MKTSVLFIALSLAVALSVYFTYQRSFVWQNFTIENSEEEIEEGMLEETMPEVEEGVELVPSEEEVPSPEAEMIES